MTAVLGLDLGTSQVKALLCADDGTVLGQGQVGYQVTVPRAGWAEIDPELWWQATCAAVRAATGPAPVPVAGLAIAGQMHGVVLSTERSVAIRPAVTWLDRRASAETEDYLRLPAHLRALLGNAPSPGMAGPILLWLSRHEPAVYQRARWALQPKDWLRLRLTNDAATDPTDASGTLLFDLDCRAWATGVVAALGLRAALLPPVRPSLAIAGSLQPDIAEQLGLRPGLPVAVGAADTAASLFAARLPPGRALLTLGTGGQLIAPTVAPAVSTRGINVFCSVDGGTYRLAAAQNVGVTLDWVCRTLGASWAELYGTAARPWRADTPVFLPYLAGERWDHGGSGGAWTGLTLAHQRDDLLRAALEGVAFLLRGKLDDLRSGRAADPEALQLAGGGSRHPAWRQLLADALAVPLVPAGSGSLTGQGAALIAAAAAGMEPGASTPARSDREKGIVVPAGQFADENYRRFLSAASQQNP